MTACRAYGGIINCHQKEMQGQIMTCNIHHVTKLAAYALRGEGKLNDFLGTQIDF